MALCNEYCSAMENARESERGEFIRTMLRLLPRLYISATDLGNAADLIDDNIYIDSALEEDYYESVRRAVESLMGPDDMYLEVFEEDMKYSDTPIAASIAEGVSDLFPVFYNFLDAVRDATDEHTVLMIQAVRENFEGYWSRILCNVMRALNHLRYSIREDDSDDLQFSDF